METTIPGMRKQACPTSCKTGSRLKVTLDHSLNNRMHDRDILKLKALRSKDANDWPQFKNVAT